MAERTPAGDTDVLVVGGGITGLATAWFLRGSARVTVLEGAERLGGKIRTEQLAGLPVEAGPDTFLAREPEAVELCQALGLGDDLAAPANPKAWLWSRGALHRLPGPNVLGVPTAARSLLRGGVLSRAGTARAALDLVLPRRWSGGDPSISESVGSRLGPEVVDRLVEPLVGGIHAGRADDLSLALTAPPLAAAFDRHRSLLLGLRCNPPPPGTGPLFLGVRGGMERIIQRLVADLESAGVEIRTGVRATAVDPDRQPPSEDGAIAPSVVTTSEGFRIRAGAVVLTVPAFAAAPMVAGSAPIAAAGLAAIAHASVVVVTLGYRPAALPAYLDGAGFLVPRVDGRLVTACTWTTSKWPELRRGGLVLLRASAGRAGDDRALTFDDDTLVARVHAELAEALGLGEEPAVRLVTRWPRAFPQYQPGHAARLARIEAALARELPGVTVAGASYRGLGIAACVRQARTVGDRIRGR